MTSKNLTTRPATLPRRALTSAEFCQLEDVQPETRTVRQHRQSAHPGVRT